MKTEKLYDKSTWRPGPWIDEPDRVEWRHAGLPCLMLRNPEVGNWCGYIGLPPGHPAHGKDYDEIDVVVHGGLTYVHGCEGNICHVPEPGEPDDVWWIGFDCAHCDDYSIGIMYGPGSPQAELGARLDEQLGFPVFTTESQELARARWNRVYRDVNYVKREVERLAEQMGTP